MNFEHQRAAKSVERVYQLIKQPYICIFVLSITQNHYKECIVASSGNTFWSKFKKCETKGFFSISFCCNTLQIMFIEYLEQKTMRTNIKNIFLPVFPRIMGKTVKKTTPSTVGPYTHNQDQPIKNINNKIFCSSLWVLSVGKAFFLPRLPSKK